LCSITTEQIADVSSTSLSFPSHHPALLPAHGCVQARARKGSLLFPWRTADIFCFDHVSLLHLLYLSCYYCNALSRGLVCIVQQQHQHVLAYIAMPRPPLALLFGQQQAVNVVVVSSFGKH